CEPIYTELMSLKWLNIILAILIIWALFQQQFGDGGRQELKEKQLLLAIKEAEIVALRERNEKLTAEVNSLKNGLDAIEERARAELGMVKEDETFIQVINQTTDDGQQ
ncbi:MAG: FtsB family cell division protein, partial [Marinicella sp.]